MGVRNVERTSLYGQLVRSLDLIREARAAFSYRISTRALFTQRDAHPLARQHITLATTHKHTRAHLAPAAKTFGVVPIIIHHKKSNIHHIIISTHAPSFSPVSQWCPPPPSPIFFSTKYSPPSMIWRGGSPSRTVPHQTIESSAGSGTPTTRSEKTEVTSTGAAVVPQGASSQSSCHMSRPAALATSSSLCVEGEEREGEEREECVCVRGTRWNQKKGERG